MVSATQEVAKSHLILISLHSDPADVQCCVNINCNTATGSGICRHTNQGCPAGTFDPGNHCPGDQTIQCCVASSSTSGEPHAAETPVDTCATPKPNTCSFYPNCLEAHEHCGPDGYAIGYGLKYCNLFTNAKSKMSSSGQEWVTNTMLCLQNALVPYGTGQQTLSCPALKTFAFDTHPNCYVNSGVCLLPPSDWEIIVGTVSLSELFGSLDALKATMQTVEGCAKMYAWLIEQGIIVVLKKAEDEAKSIWHDITSWF
jgi:Stanniocalcin family